MWLTGFDAPSCSTVYLDKPMRNHTLMQTIARANRVFPGQAQRGDRGLRERLRLARKGARHLWRRQGRQNAGEGQEGAVEELRTAVDAAVLFCTGKGVRVAAIEQLPPGDMQRLARIDDAVNALISPDPLRREFLGHERLVRTLYNAVKPDAAAVEFASPVACLAAIADAIRAKLNPIQQTFPA